VKPPPERSAPLSAWMSPCPRLSTTGSRRNKDLKRLLPKTKSGKRPTRNRVAGCRQGGKFEGRLAGPVVHIVEILHVLSYVEIVEPLARNPNVTSMNGRVMVCKACSSENQQNFSAELAVAFSGIERLNLSPVYVCQKILVCLDYGYAELVFPATQLEQLKEGRDSLQRLRATAAD
jgi:hypothetical protein